MALQMGFLFLVTLTVRYQTGYSACNTTA